MASLLAVVTNADSRDYLYVPALADVADNTGNRLAELGQLRCGSTL